MTEFTIQKIIFVFLILTAALLENGLDENHINFATETQNSCKEEEHFPDIDLSLVVSVQK